MRYVKIKTAKMLDNEYPKSDFDDHIWKLSDTSGYPKSWIDMCGTIIEINNIGHILSGKHQHDGKVSEEMIEKVLTKETDPEYFL